MIPTLEISAGLYSNYVKTIRCQGEQKCRPVPAAFENPSNKIIPQETWNLVDKLLLEKISSAGISRVTGISEICIQNYINKKYEDVSKETEDVFKQVF